MSLAPKLSVLDPQYKKNLSRLALTKVLSMSARLNGVIHNNQKPALSEN